MHYGIFLLFEYQLERGLPYTPLVDTNMDNLRVSSLSEDHLHDRG